MEHVTFVCAMSLLLLCSSAAALGSSNASADELTLLSVKSMLSDPTGSLASWNTSNRLCNWRGVTCSRKHPGRIVELQMNSFDLAGRVSPFLGNLSFLRTLDLGNSHLAGPIPRQLGRLSRLQVLILSANSLEGNIPAELGRCTHLTTLALEANHLHGEIPAEVGSLRNLVYLNLGINGLSGEIPPSIANLSSIQVLVLGENAFSGAIPSSLGGLPNLSVLYVYLNNLSGSIPLTIWNISSLTKLSVAGNELSGTIPPNAFDKVPRLQLIYMNYNQFHGHIPSSLANASNLRSFQIGYNHFSGTVPSELGGLKGLQWLVLMFNSLEAKEPKDWNFMIALTNCSQLQHLELDSNRFIGELPSSISNLSTSLTVLALSHNEIFGTIPEKISNLIGLQTLALENNNLSGALPSSLSMLQNLNYLSLQYNNFGGDIRLVGNLTQLKYFYICYNSLNGSIPATLGNLLSLLEFDLSNNNFTGNIPSNLLNISSLAYVLDLSHNLLEGAIPAQIGDLKSVSIFHAESNRLSGEIPGTIGECQILQNLHLQNNLLSGTIPQLLSGLKNLEILDLSNNNLSGHIPKFLGNMSTLIYLNLSFNNLTGEVPTFGVFSNASAFSIHGNYRLCGGILDLHLPRCSFELLKRKKKFPMVPTVVPLLATVGIFLFLYFFLACHKKRSRESPSTMSMRGHQLISYPQLVQAIDGFSTSTLLGTGSYGSVYKAKLYDETGENGNLVAVKVLKLQTPGALKSFTAECEAMRNLRHRNLVKIITVCSSIDFNGNDFKAIVLDFMPNGSLEEWLHPNTNNQREERHLNLIQRVSILFDVAYALDYLHFHGSAPIVHCDLKPSNVLLDVDMVAHVGDFGLARIIAEGCSSFQPSTSSMGFRGTIGYAPPEYGAGNMVSTHGDIYSYGVLILEMVTGKRPTDNTFEQGLSLRKYVEMALNNRVMDIIDMDLVREIENGPATVDGPSNRRRFYSLISLLKLGMFCSEEMPSSRMSTNDIIKELHAITKALA